MTVSIQSGPSWVSLGSDGRLTGTPTAVGSFPVVLESTVGIYSATTTVTIIVSQLAPVYFDVVSQLLAIGSVALSFQAYIGLQEPTMFPLTLAFGAVEVLVARFGLYLEFTAAKSVLVPLGTASLSFEAVEVLEPRFNLLMSFYAEVLGVLGDDFADAILVPLDCSPSTQSVIVTGNNVGATLETGEPKFYSLVNRTVWFTFVAPSTTDYSFDNLGSNYQTTTAIYSGSNFTDLSLLGSDVFTPGGNDGYFTPPIIVSLTAGTTYYVQLGGVGSFFNEGDYVLTIDYTCV